MEAAENGEAFRDLSGSHKAMLYLMAAFTGLRVSELALRLRRWLQERDRQTLDTGVIPFNRNAITPRKSRL